MALVLLPCCGYWTIGHLTSIHTHMLMKRRSCKTRRKRRKLKEKVIWAMPERKLFFCKRCSLKKRGKIKYFVHPLLARKAPWQGSSQSTCGNGSAPHHVSPPTPPLQNTLHMHNCTLLDTLHCTQRTLRCKTHSTLLFVQKCSSVTKSVVLVSVS